MKKLSFLHSVLATLALAATLTSCSKDDDNNDSAPQEPAATYHYDLTVVAGNHGGMSKDKSHITLSVASLNDATATISFEGKGAEITDYTMENIYDGKYYYQVPISSDRFSKLQFKGNKMQVVQEQKFKENTYKSRNYTHAWLGDNSLIIMSTNGEHTKVIWTKLNTNDMTIIGEGTLPIEIAEGYNVLTTSGVLTYATTSCSISTTTRKRPAVAIRLQTNHSSELPSSIHRQWLLRRKSSTKRLLR